MPGQTSEALGSQPPWNAAWNLADLTAGLPSGVTLLGSVPGVAVTPRGLEMFYTATDARIYHRIGDGSHWSAPEAVSSNVFPPGIGVGVASTATQMVIAAPAYDPTGGAPHILTRGFIFSSGSWSPWLDTGGHTYNPGVAVAADTGYFYLGAVGTEGHLWWNYTTLPGVGWHGWNDVGGNCDNLTVPSAASWGNFRVDFLVARVNDREAFHFYVENFTPASGFEDLGVPMSWGALSSYGSNELDFFARTPSGKLYQRNWSAGWGTWTQLLGCDASLPLSAAASPVRPNRIDLFVAGTDSSQWHTFAGAGASSTPGGVPYCCGLHGVQCCPSSVDRNGPCKDDQHDYCEPTTNLCQACGSGVSQECCHDSRYPVPVCDETVGLQCNLDSARCEAFSSCGTNGHVCCFPNKCTDGSSCLGGNEWTQGMCRKSTPTCASAGAACGATACCSGLVCVSGKCQSTSGQLTCNGKAATSSAQIYYLEIRDVFACARTVETVYANSSTDAVGCGRSAFPGYDVRVGSSSSQITEYEYHYGTDACFNATMPAFSQSDADICASYNCPSCTQGGC